MVTGLSLLKLAHYVERDGRARRSLNAGRFSLYFLLGEHRQLPRPGPARRSRLHSEDLQARFPDLLALVVRRCRPPLMCYTGFSISGRMKPLRSLGCTLKSIRDFPEAARQDAGYQRDKVQRGEQPDDFKPMPTIGRGVEELRIWDDTGTYRVVYTARLADAIYVLHAFQKQTQTTSKRDIELAKARFTELMRGTQ